MRVTYGKSVHGEGEIKAVVQVLRTSTQMGKNVEEFEKKVAALFGKKYGIMVNSGSSALLLAMQLLDLSGGSEIITPALTFATTVSAIVKNGLIPAFVDVEPDTFCIDVDKIESFITSKTRAVCIPNLIGNLPDWLKITHICKKYKLKIIEDSCDTLGATVCGKSSGYYSDISATSFYGSHIINCAGNGGMLCVNDPQLARRARLLRSWGRSSSLFGKDSSEKIENRFDIKLDGIPYDAKFVFGEVGYNFEPSELGAAFGLVQLKKLGHNISTRIRNFNAHCRFFKKYDKWFVLPRQLPRVRTGWLAFPLIVKDTAPFTRTQLQIFLEKKDIQTRVVFTGNINRQPGFKNISKRVIKGGYPNTDQAMRGGILMGCHQGLTFDMIKHVHFSFTQFVEKFKYG